MGRRRGRRPVRLLRQPVAADRPARGAEAAAQHRHSRRRRRADRQSRRHRRRGGALERIAALSAQGLRRDRGPALLFAFRHRPDRHRPRRLSRRHRARRHGGRLDADPAARQEPVPDPGAHAVAQDPGGDPGSVARAQIFQGPDPRALSQPRLFRLRRLRRRSGGAEIFRQERPPGDAVGGRGAGRTDEVADQACAQPQPHRRQRARRAGHHRDGRAGPHHRGDGQAGARLARPGRARKGRRLGQLRRRLCHGHARRHGRRDRRGHRRHHDARSAHAGGGRARADRRTRRQGRKVRRRAGRAGRARSRRRGQGAGRRPQLRRQPIQPRRRRQAPARLDIQAVRLSRRAGEGPDARHGARGRADLGQGLAAGELFARSISAR